MLTAPYVHFNTRKPHDGRGSHDSNVMTMIDYTNLYIKNLDADVTSIDLVQRFNMYGKIISARVMKDPITSKSKGYGFVSFTHMEEASKALQQMNGALIKSKCIIVTFHEHKKQVNKQQQQQQRNSQDLSSSSPQQQQQQQQHHHHTSYPSPQSASYGYMPEPPKSAVLPPHNPWNDTCIWMHNNKSPVVVPHHAYPSMHHVPIATTTTTNTNLPIQQQQVSVNSQIQYQKLRDAVYSQLSEYQQKDLNDLVDLIQSLKKRDLSLCLFNPVFLKQKIEEAYEALYLFGNPPAGGVRQPTSMTTTPSLVHLNLNGEDTQSTHSGAAAILSSLEGMTMNKKKRVFGDIFFPYVRATGVKHAPKVTIRLLDTVPLDELAFNMYDKKELTRKAQYAYSELYC
ncbi:uncharacterized protein EV154DRAFT_445614 [Mucor mucedo]|uniref:uncharacterized protein n=1 Tax=Mucor mucedo TaxID=29922 RepID=UPI00222048FB|nr:uncharacterized protein EV154DRAFT_445614 [Mucor mucedo]KAI7889778.1 hypothetical protein EV154DRAFT_445614 [Mucor mucedo]